MKLGFLILCLLALSACQTKSVDNSRQRNPDAVLESTTPWREIINQEPATFLDILETKKRIQDRNRKISILQECGVNGFKGEALEMDLLFIRLNNWPEGRLQKEYLHHMSPQNLRCLQEKSTYLGV